MQKAYRNMVIMISALALTLICVHANAAPQQGKQKQKEQATKQEAAADFNNYRVKYTVDEVENGKTTNSRAYTLMVKAGSTATVRIGSRVPFSVGGTVVGSIQYQDVGMNIDSGITRQERSLLLHTKVSMSSLAGKGAGSPDKSNPVFGQFQVENSTVVTLGRPTFVGSADDIASNRQYLVRVTVTKAK